MTLVVDETLVTEDIDNFHLSETEDMGSLNHSYLQAKLTSLFLMMSKYIALTELSLDTTAVKPEFPGIGDSIVPDLAIYPTREINLAKDVLRMTEMPLLAIEILSPMQAPQLLVDKIAVYFALGIQSCWLVYPTAQTVSVFSAPYQFQSFSTGEIQDKTLDISLDWGQIFT
ncbi:MAG: Uma2 family endonuclease [Caldilineaceae bacterium]|nr:Uma2 family endonuclease [Caldilineaceae bacterium]